LNPSIAVIIVNFNSGDALGATLASLEAGLSGCDWQAIVVDNASQDGSQEAATRYRSVTLLRQAANSGFAAGVNRGAAATSAPLVLILNPDCRLASGAVRSLTDEMERHPDCGVIGPKILDPDGALQESARGDPNMLTGLFGRTSALSRRLPRLSLVRRNLVSESLSKAGHASERVDWVSGACMLVRREAFQQVRGFDEGYFLYWEDADFCRRLRNAGRETRYMPSATVVHDVGQSSRNATSLATREFHRSAYRYFATHVVPQWWHPGRIVGWTILMLRWRLKSIRR
jgi:GT2 family glycosyltransferase